MFEKCNRYKTILSNNNESINVRMYLSPYRVTKSLLDIVNISEYQDL